MMNLKESGTEDLMPESRPVKRYADKLAEQDEESLSPLRRKNGDNSEPEQKESNSNDAGNKDSVSGFVQPA